MNFIADLHIHSRFSLATSRSLNVSTLAEAAIKKGIKVLGSGDFTHPAWRQELKEDCIYHSHTGLLAPNLKKLRQLRKYSETVLPQFCLQAEISSIYKRDGKTRRIHNLIYAPNFEAAEKISARLEKIGNLASDGRPILKIDSRDLLEITLEAGSWLVPAHIWTPWYSLFGSKSGFDRLEDCYGDLSKFIFALETGLSSDPAMNRMVSDLDKYCLISNSDAHSGANLGREANLFEGQPGFDNIFNCLRARAVSKQLAGECKFTGTLEFYPQEGKYHLDGHRKCGFSLVPDQCDKLNSICPVCGKPLTIGVLHRVLDLADRKEPAILQNEPEALMLVPLDAIFSHIMGLPVTSRRVLTEYENALSAIGPELEILHFLPIAEIYDWWEPMGEAVFRVRSGKIKIEAGFDGQYGRVEIFDASELAAIRKSIK